MVLHKNHIVHLSSCDERKALGRRAIMASRQEWDNTVSYVIAMRTYQPGKPGIDSRMRQPSTRVKTTKNDYLFRASIRMAKV